ncbi:OapC/ArvC family zinc-ribbon domain-containing protein [Halococcus hamelinensis]|nr:Zn-ribbon containing protein [Halococcus hamelinensis]
MPHQCTQCGHTFPDGSKEMLSGCPECGGNKFKFEPAADARASSATPPDSGPSPSAENPAQADARREVASGDDHPPDTADPVGGPGSTGNEGVSNDGLSEPPTNGTADPPPETEPTADTPDPASDTPDPAGESDMAALRRELDDQFESIKILEPGQYELNLMELYNREEYIIALQEDGQYVIEVPETWLGDDEA